MKIFEEKNSFLKKKLNLLLCGPFEINSFKKAKKSPEKIISSQFKNLKKFFRKFKLADSHGKKIFKSKERQFFPHFTSSFSKVFITKKVYNFFLRKNSSTKNSIFAF